MYFVFEMVLNTEVAKVKTQRSLRESKNYAQTDPLPIRQLFWRKVPIGYHFKIEARSSKPPIPAYADVALPVPLRRTFTYRLPSALGSAAVLGSRVLVPFGKRNLTGYIVDLQESLDPQLGLDESDVKDAIELLDESPLITPEILELTKWAADYYAVSWGEMLKASLPAGINSPSERVISINEAGKQEIGQAPDRMSAKYEILRFLEANGETSQRVIEKQFGETAAKRSIRELMAANLVDAYFRNRASVVKPKLRKAVRLIASSAVDEKPLTEGQRRVLAELEKRKGEVLFTELLDAAGTGASPITSLARRGMVEVSLAEVRRDPLAEAELPEVTDIELSREQQDALSAIGATIETGGYKALLLHGITGSGKTEIYIRAMRTCLLLGRSALMLVPEIALTPIFSRRLRSVFSDQVAIIHSNLSAGERYDEWRRIRSGDARIVIGTRSAVFAPLESPGLLIVDEEHDASYRQHESPFYSARDTAVMRANLSSTVVVLGSATPSLESFENARAGKYQYLKLQNRPWNRPLAKAELIDMREVFRKAGKDITISPQLLEAIKTTHSNGEQSIVLLNRRGFSQFVLCRTCGESLRCRNCDITLTYHKRDPKLVCHYCGFRAAVPAKCPFCSSEYLYFIGRGTEQLEQILQKMLPDMSIARIDRDTMARKGEMAKTLLAFDRGEIDMLIGTQMLAKGHDFHNVTLVGVISVDTGLGLPDFRSAERTFQLLTQVAGRAGRGELPGRVLIQTYYPEHYALRHAVKQDFEGFFEVEMRFRERMGYPPFVALAMLMVRGKDQNAVNQEARIVRDGLDAANAEKKCRIVGPGPASLARLKGEYRVQLLVKSPNRRDIREVVDLGLARADEGGADLRHVQLEIDPVDML